MLQSNRDLPRAFPPLHNVRPTRARGSVSEFLGWIPKARHARVGEAAFSWNYATVLNLICLVLAIVLFVRFFRTGGPQMLKMMNKPARKASDDERPVPPVPSRA